MAARSEAERTIGPTACLCSTPPSDEDFGHAVWRSLGIASIRQFRWQYGFVPGDMDRSLAPIDLADLLRLAALAADAEAGLFERNPHGSARYADRLLGRALCQGAALHYVNGQNGVKDFDVWSFYAQHDDWPFPARWRGTRDFGPSKFGRYPGDPPQYVGRRVDLLGRSLPVASGTDPAVPSTIIWRPGGLSRLGNLRRRQRS